MSMPTIEPDKRNYLPTLEVERALWASGRARVAGVDEVGRGSLSGPVVAAAVLLSPECNPITGVRDSKLLARSERERLEQEIRACVLAVGLGAASVAEIERLNIYHASHLAMARALARIGGYDHALVDGPKIPPLDRATHTAIVDGDALCYSIACASIVAKVVRDRLMAVLGRRYPHYGWERNAGYSTRSHREALRAIGPSPFHRRGYAPVRACLERQQLFASLSSADDDARG